MKLSVLQENLAKGLAVVGRAVSARSVLPVLQNVLLATEEGQLKLSATDLSTSITCWIGAKIEEEGSTTVPARLLGEFVNSLPPKQIDIELVTRTQTLHLVCGRTEANVKSIDAQEFPIIPTADEAERLSVDAAALRRLISQVTFAAATDESRPILTGALADFQDDRITMAAADGFRLSVRSALLDDAVPSGVEIIIPARALQELGRVAAGLEETVDVILPPKGNQILFRLESPELGGAIELVSQLIEGNFPDYNQIIPTDRSSRTVVETEEFLQAARIALLFARDAANIVRLKITPSSDGPGSMTVAANAAEVGDDVSQVDATVDGDEIEIAFNGRYLIDVLSAVDTPKIALETSSPASPGVFRPVGDDDFVHVIMPMHISQ